MDTTECIEMEEYFNSLFDFKRGHFGDVKIYDVFTKKYIVKRITIYNNDKNNNDYVFNNEINILQKIQDLTISPRYISSLKCITYGYIIMERIDGITLKEYTTTINPILSDKELELIAMKIRLLHSYNISSNDLHTGNIMCTLDNNKKIVNIYIIDFGISNIITNLNEKKYKDDSDYTTFLYSITSSLDDTTYTPTDRLDETPKWKERKRIDTIFNKIRSEKYIFRKNIN